MTAEWLVCANCAGRVSDAGCAVCRAQLIRMREQRDFWSLLSNPATLVALVLALAAVTLLVARPA
jgi:hypothetical protein